MSRSEIRGSTLKNVPWDNQGTLGPNLWSESFLRIGKRPLEWRMAASMHEPM